MISSTTSSKASVDPNLMHVPSYSTHTENSLAVLTCCSCSLIGLLVQRPAPLGKMGHFVIFSSKLDLPAFLPPMTTTFGSAKGFCGRWEVMPRMAVSNRPKALLFILLNRVAPSKSLWPGGFALIWPVELCNRTQLCRMAREFARRRAIAALNSVLEKAVEVYLRSVCLLHAGSTDIATAAGHRPDA